ncbi:MAG: T9SS-dependent M36 family metallopeptidase, partial [Saprospiraceae bacterium]
MKPIPLLSCILLILVISSHVFSQTTLKRDAAMEAVRSHLPTLGLVPTDWAELHVTDFYRGRKSRLTYLYLQQARAGVPIDGATATVAFGTDGEMQLFRSRLVGTVDKRLGPALPAFDASTAIFKAAELLDIQVSKRQVRILEDMSDERMTTLFAPEGIALEPVVAALSWVPVDGEQIRLAWQVMWYTTDASHRWVLHLDATTGAELSRHDQVLSCDFGSPAHAHTHACLGYDFRGYRQSRQIAAAFHPTATPEHPDPVGPTQLATGQSGGSYRVFPVPVESPNHGVSELVVNPADTVASPFGWHDVDGQTGAEYTITRGNNVHAYHDADDTNDSAGDEPDGGADLIFDFPYNPADPPEAYRDAAVTNLFYWCNVVHDVWYYYGFDEAAGNFQLNNLGLGGEEGDYVRAEAQDGSGVNNANFSSSADGSSARLQMYLWTNQANTFFLEVLNPDTVAGFYQTNAASFGPPVPDTPLVGTLVQAISGSASATDACEAITNAAEIEGNIALIDRGNCAFTDKVSNAQNAGASAVIVCNNVSGGTISMGGSDGSITIPSVMISLEDCMTLKQFLSQGMTVKLQDSFPKFFDGDFDNIIIAHEYGHGLSIRMTGGPSQGGCLFNDEQMGEGWSDFAGLVLTMEAGDQGSDVRGVGTFALNQSTTGNGIRPAPYSTDFGVNSFTYGKSNDPSISKPHGVGFIWATALWDLTWDLIDVYGFDEDFRAGQGGNNIAIQLVTEGMKLQPCNPGMIDGRDAILAADQLLYDGANQCLIWEAFARRGFGFSASQGSAFDRFDQVEAFDLPPICQIPVTAPSAALSVNVLVNCTGEFSFSDLSTDVPQQWLW